MKPKLKPGTWTQFKGGVHPNCLMLIVHFAPYVREKENHYFFYSFTPKGRFTGSAWISEWALQKVKAPAFAKDIVVFPELLLPKEAHEKREGLLRGGMIYTKKNLVAIDTMVMQSKVLSKWLCDYFKHQQMWESKDCHECDGAIFQKESWVNKRLCTSKNLQTNFKSQQSE